MDRPDPAEHPHGRRPGRHVLRGGLRAHRPRRASRGAQHGELPAEVRGAGRGQAVRARLGHRLRRGLPDVADMGGDGDRLLPAQSGTGDHGGQRAALRRPGNGLRRSLPVSGSRPGAGPDHLVRSQAGQLQLRRERAVTLVRRRLSPPVGRRSQDDLRRGGWRPLGGFRPCQPR